MKLAFLLFWLSLSIQPVFAQSVAQSSLDQIGRGATGYTSPEQAKAMMESMLKSLPPAQRLNIQKQLEAIKAEQSQIGAAYPGHSASTGAPSGAPFALPAGLKIGQITGPSSACIGEAKAGQRFVMGSGQLVGLCLTFENTGSETITLTLPAGLIFTSSDPGTQNGILIHEVCIVIPPMRTVAVLVRAYCLNEQREVPDGTARFSIGPVSTMPALQKIFRQVQERVIKDNEESYQHFQEMLWVPLRSAKLPFIGEKPTETYFEKDRKAQCVQVKP